MHPLKTHIVTVVVSLYLCPCNIVQNYNCYIYDKVEFEQAFESSHVRIIIFLGDDIKDGPSKR